MWCKLAIIAFLSLAYAETTTFFSFSRRIQTCDPKDRPIEEATSKMIWSYNDQVPKDDNTILKHDEKGIKSVRFFNDDGGDPNLPDDALPLDITLNNIKINFNGNSGPTTQYWCSAYHISEAFKTKRQIIRVEPIIDQRNYKNVHHMLVYLCQFNLTETDLAYQGGCYSSPNVSPPTNIRQCNGQSIVAGWAVGGYPMNYPDYIGMPMEGDNIYMMMEIHYDNPNQLEIIDSSGMRFWHTAQYRKYDAGTMNFGMSTNPVFLIPPYQSSYRYTAYCPEECSLNNYPEGGINITAVNLHTHLAGRQIYFRHFRNGTELPPLLAEPYYDFNYQEMTMLPQERLVLPGDTFQLDCYYDTSDRSEPTNFGLSTQEEMCLAYVLYYPKLPSSKEHCYYGNFTGIGSNTNQTINCGLSTGSITNWSGPFPTTPYTPPACNYNAPPPNSTTPVLVDRLNTSRYSNSIEMDEDGKYKLYWSLDRENYLFHAAVEVKTTGWVGLGVSPAGMDGADVLIAWIKDNEIHFGDRFATQKSMPPLDSLQDFYDISGGQYTTSDEPALSQGAVVGISVGGSIVFLAALLLVFICYRKKKSDLNTVLTKDTYGGTNDTENLDPPSMNTNPSKKESVEL